jgi:acyl-CoA-dependent ceramide synthase
VITLTLLSALQSLNLFWLFFILRIAYRFVVHNVAKDDRSEDETETELIEDSAAAATPAGKQNGVAKLNGSAAAAAANGAAKKSK